jgi:GT2 family glycosyltransferase
VNQVRVDVGVASFGNPEKLDRALASIRAMSTTAWRCLVFDNPHPDDDIREKTRLVIVRHASEDPNIVPYSSPTNVGYVGAVNHLFAWAEHVECIAYMDNDAEVLTPGWDAQMVALLREHREIGIVFPNSGGYPIPHDGYEEVLWAAGFCWMTTRQAAEKARWHHSYKLTHAALHEPPPYFDPSLGHHEEVDFVTRLRLCGYTAAALPSIRVAHHESATRDPASQERITLGVQRWVTKWNRYFCGEGVDYFSKQVTRHEDWLPSALYLERFWKQHLGDDFNATPETRMVGGVERDLCRVPRFPGLYRGRIV